MQVPKIFRIPARVFKLTKVLPKGTSIYLSNPQPNPRSHPKTQCLWCRAWKSKGLLLWNNRRGTATTRGPGELTWFHCCGPQKLACSILYLRCIQCHTVDKTLDAPKINNRTSSILWAWAQLIASISNPPSSLTLNCIIIIITTWQMLLLGCCSLLPLYHYATVYVQKRKPVFRRAILYFFYMVWTVLVSSPLQHEFLNNY